MNNSTALLVLHAAWNEVEAAHAAADARWEEYRLVDEKDGFGSGVVAAREASRAAERLILVTHRVADRAWDGYLARGGTVPAFWASR